MLTRFPTGWPLAPFTSPDVFSRAALSHDSQKARDPTLYIARCGCICTAEQVPAEVPQLHLVQDPPLLRGKRIPYITVFGP